eukprot:TRINITY_DN74569_c0_g1_i1.p1 TRINITY_DN74569_c0_g1~~TRINITY_DN74569_c0_g1_i1.p1  ORF type:complete len:344 (-),score=99.75 TRINITY_DN74569_c0_g1_i1:272-1303(-)
MAVDASRLAEYKEQIAACNPDKLSEFGRDAIDPRFAAQVPAYDDLRDQLRALKFKFVQAQEQLNFVQQATLWDGTVTPASFEDHRRQEKEVNKSIKQKIKDQEQQQARLLEQVVEATNSNRRLFEQCQRDLESVQQADADGIMPMDICGDAGRDGSQGVHGQAVREAGIATQEVATRFLKVNGEMATRRQALEQELAHLREQQRLDQRRARYFEKLTQEEIVQCGHLERLLMAEDQLGLPRYYFDDARSVVTVCAPESEALSATAGIADFLRNIREDIRTVEVKYDEAGRLLHAEPHPSLGLDAEAAIAVERDDLGRLLTSVWAQMLRAAQLSVDPAKAAGGA